MFLNNFDYISAMIFTAIINSSYALLSKYQIQPLCEFGIKLIKIQNLKMGDILTCLCCCFTSGETAAPAERPRPSKKKKKPVLAKQTRLKTKYKKEDFMIVSDEERRENKVKAYCCPICTLYYAKIIACSDCINFICLSCFEDYDKKTASNKEKLKCPFCSSEKSFFADYQLDPHSYFDTTNKGFLPKEDRVKMDQEIYNSQGNRPQPEETIEQDPDRSSERHQ